MSIRRHVGLCLGVLLLLAVPSLAQTPTVSFVDANGSAVSTYLEKTRVYVRVEDPSANSNPWAVDAIDVPVSASLSGDSEIFVLNETGTDTGVFEGSRALDLNAPPYQAGVLETSYQPGPPVVHDTITAQYGVAFDTATLVPGRIQLLDDLGRPAAGYTQGDLVHVQVEDHLRYNDPGVKESILVAVNVLAVSDEEFIYLQETGNSTGIFEGSIPAALYATYDSDGVVGAPVGNQVHAQYAIGTEEWIDAYAPLVGSRAEILDRAGQPAELVPESAPIRLRVVDRTVGSSSPDTLPADVSSLFGGDAESVTLAETGADTGVYEAELPTALNFISPTAVGNGRLETGENAGPPHQFDTITLSYNGPSGASSDTATTYGSETLFVDEWGNDTEVYAVGTTVFIRVIDYNRDQSGANDLIPVTLFGHTRGDYETVNLIETGSHTGIFEGSLPIQYGFYNVSTYDGWLEADAGETIEVQHTDVMGQTASADLAVIRNADIHFFDEQGRPTHELLEGGTASIRLYNFPGNQSSWDVDNTYVQVRSVLTGDMEFVQVTETGRNTGIFEGTIRLVFTELVNGGNGTLEVSNSGSPAYTQDTVIASYSDVVQTSATTVGARVWLVDRFGQDAESYAVGDLVGVRVEDHNVDDPQVRQTLQAVIVVNSQAGDVEGVNVTETGFNTGVFVGTISSRLSSAKTPNNGTLETEGGDRLEARHVWQHSPQLARDNAVMTASSVLFVDAQGQPVDSYLEASRAYVRLVYAGGNASPSVDVTTVMVSAAISADAEVLTLTETGGDTGVFTGSIRLSSGPVSPNDGFLQTGRNPGSESAMDTLTVTHAGPNGSATDTVAIEGSRTSFVNALGNPVEEYARSSRAYVRVEDQSANRPGLYDTVLVTVRSLGIGDQETIALQETTRDSGVFLGSLPLETSSYGQTYANPGDGKLQSDAGQEIEAVHTDWMGATSTDRAMITYSSVEFIDEAGQPTAEILEGGVARLRMFDPLSSNSSTYLTVRSRYGNDQEYVQVTETSYQSHIFEGTVQLRSAGPGGGLQGNNLLETSTSGSPEFRPDELTAIMGLGATDAHAVTVPSRIRFIDGFGRVVSSFAVGERAGVRVEDNNLDDPSVRGTISVPVREQSGVIGDSESVTLTETGYDTNVFEGSVLLSPPPYTGPGDGKLLASPGDVLHAEHGNVTTPAASVVEASVASSQVLFVDAKGQPASVYMEGSRAYVRVVDVFANQTPSADVVTVTLRTTLGPDVEQLTLTETGGATGVFTGSIPLTVSSLNPNDGWLTTVQDLGTPHEFDTLRAEYNGAVATAATISSRTWFVDAYGNPVESYARGSRVYIRVEDQTANRPGLYDTALVMVRSLGSGDQESLMLLETTRDSGVFAGSLPLEVSLYGPPSANPGDGKLQAEAGQEIEAVHTDWTGSTTSSDRATIDYASIEFVDEAGVTTFEALEGGVVRLRVFDPFSGYGGPYYAQVRSRYGNDQEYVQLTETGYQTHILMGTIQLHSSGPGGGLQGNNILETSTSGSPEYRAEELTAFYSGQAVATVRPSRVRFIDGFGQVVSSFAVGERVGVRVEDHNLDNPLVRGTVSVNVQASNGGDVESITLDETGYDTNIFEGSIPTGPGTPSGGNGTLQVQPGQTIEAWHSNATTPRATVAQATINRATVLFVDASGQPASVYLEGSRAYVRVADFFANQSSAVDVLTVTLRTTLGPDVEQLTLTETGGATGVFTGSIPLAFSSLNPNDGWLTTVQDLGTPHEYDTIRAEYNGAVATVGTISSRTWFVDAYGNPVESYGRGSRAYIRVEDHTADRPGLYDTVQATVRSLGTGDQETVTLLETARGSGIFAGSLPLETSQYGQTNANPGDGKLQSEAGQEIEAVHTDWTGSTTSSDRATIDYVSVEFIDEAGITTFEVLEGGLVRLRLFDLFSSPYNSPPSVRVESRYGHDREYVQLTETSYQSHIFEGTIQLRSGGPGGGLEGNNLLETSTSGNPEYRPEELTAYYSGQTMAVVRPSRVRFIDGFGQVVSSFAVGDRAGVRVEDHNLDDPLVRGTIQVNVQSSSGDAEGVTLTETGYDTNIYEGSILTRVNGTGGDGSLQVLPGQTIEAVHGNATTPNATVAQAAITGASVLFVDPSGQPASVYLEGSRAYVRVVDITANQTSSTDTLTVTLRTTLGPDVEQVILTETGPATGVFTGSIALGVSNLSPNNGQLTTVQDVGTPHEYDTIRAEHNGAVATIATISSRTWFVDAYGNPAETYSRGSRAYIRVEDHTADRPGLYDTVQVTVRSLFVGDQETVTLLETTRDSGIFAGSLPLEMSNFGQTYANPGDGKLQSDAYEQIEAAHTDWTGSTTSTDRATLDYGSVEFVDETGATTFEVLEGGIARVRVFDPTSNSNPGSVRVESRYADDQEYVPLTETFYESHIYEGTIQLRSGGPGGGVPGNHFLETSTSGNPEYRPEELTAFYGGQAVAVVRPSRVWFINGFGQVVPGFAVGDPVGVRVEDHNLGDPLVRGTVQVNIQASNGDVEGVTLTETGYDTNIFEGSVASAAGTPASGNNALQVLPGQTIEARYGNATTPNATVARAAITGATVLFVDASGQPASVYLEGSRAYLRVVDTTANQTPSIDNLTVTLRTTLGPDVEALILYETGGATGVFTGSIPLTVSTLGQDGKLTTVQDVGTPHEYDTIRAEYNGAVATIGTISSRTAFVDAAGWPADAYARGTRAYVRVEDHTADQSAGTDTVQVTVRSLTTGDLESLSLQEVSGGIFEGSLALETNINGQTYPSHGDGKLQSDANEVIEAVHTDWTGSTQSSDQASVLYAAVEFIDPSGQITAEVIEGGVARLRVFDLYGSYNSSISTRVQSLYGGDQEYVALTETGYQTHVFEGTIQLRSSGPGGGLQGNNILETSNSGNPEFRQEVVTASYINEARAVVVPSRAWFLGGQNEVVTGYAVGSPVRVRVEDHNAGSAGQVDSVTVSLTTPSDSESLTLTETGAGTGIFEGSIASGSGAGVIDAAPGITVMAEHSNITTPNKTRAQAVFTDNHVPVAVNDAAQTEEAPVTIPVLANDSDPDSEALQVTAVTQGAHGAVVINAGQTVTYTPASGFVGTDIFTYDASDPRGGRSRATVTVTVISANAPPTPAADSATTPEDQAVNIAVLANDTDPDNDTLQVVSVTTPANGTAALQPNGSVTFTPAADWNGQTSFTYTVRDPDGLTATATVTVTVTPVNDPPVANDDTATVAEDGSVAVSVLANDSDIDGGSLTITAVTQGAHGGVAITGSTVTYTPAPNYNGTDSFTYTVSDGNGGTDTASVAVTVTGSNDNLTAVDDSATTTEDTPVTVAVLANDSDPDNDTLSVSAVTQGTNGSVAIIGTQVRYTPNADFHGTDSFTYTASDGNGSTGTATVTVTVSSANDAPVANDDNATVGEDSSVSVSVKDNDTDADGDTLDVTAVTQGANGAVVLNAEDTVTYTPNADFHGSDSFTYTVSDGNGSTDTATVSVTVTSANDAPAAADDTATTPEDTPVTVSVLANDTDVDNDTLTVSAVTQGTNGTVAILGSQVTYTPNANFHGTDSFTYTANDGNGGTDTATVTVTINPTNDAPVADDDAAAVVEDDSVAVAVLGNDSDVDGDSLTITAVTQGAHGTVAIVGSTVTYTPAPNYNGTDSFTYTISDGTGGGGGSDTATVSMTVTASNDALTANDDAATVAEDGSVTVAVLANDTDPENDPLTVVSVTQGTNGAVAIVGNQVTYTPNANFNGTDTFTYTASDGNGGTGGATVTVTVTPVNDAPVAGDDTASVVEDGSVTISVLGDDTDVDGDTLTVAAVTQGTNGTVVIGGSSQVTYTPATNFHGTDSFTYTVSDGHGGTDTANVTVTVGAANDAPVANNDSATTAEDTAVSVYVLANDTDLDGDTLSVASVTQGTNGAVTISGTQVVYTPGANFHGSDSFTYTASDGNGGTATATVNVTITPVNDAPVAVADTATVAEDGSVTISVRSNDTDVDGDAVTITAVTQGAHGSATHNGSTVTYTPAANYNGPDTFTYTLSDGHGGSAVGTVSMTVTGTNDVPVAVNDSATVAEDGSVVISVRSNDSDLDGDTLTITAVTQGANGSVTHNGSTVTYTPNANYNGSNSFTYTISDGNGGTATASVAVTITPVNDAPVAVNDTATTLAEVAVTVNVRANDTDVDSPTLTVTAVTQGAHGTASLNAGATVTYTPAAGWVGPDSFTYTISDGSGGTATATVNVTVQAPARVTGNLQVLYTFNEGSGTTVNDVSGVGTPYNLTIGSASAVSWLPGALSLNSAVLVQNTANATKVINACKSSNEVTMEAWVAPDNTTQTGPAAIASIAQNTTKRDVTLGQSGTAYSGQLKTSTTGNDGTLTSSSAVATTGLTHVVYTRSSTGAVRIYVNGTQVASSTLTGNLSGWTNYNLALGGEPNGARYWVGDLHLVAIYSRALTAAEARQNWLAGAN